MFGRKPPKTKPEDIEMKATWKIIIIKLISGEEIITKMLFSGNCPIISNKTNTYKVIDPYVFLPIVNYKTGKTDLFIEKFMPFSSTINYDFKVDHVMSICIPVDELIDIYNKCLIKPVNVTQVKPDSIIKDTINTILSTPYFESYTDTN